jgi:hypothetical protein
VKPSGPADVDFADATLPRRVRRLPDRTPEDALSALRQASTLFETERAGPPRRRSRRSGGVLLGLALSILVGGIVSFMGPLEYRCTIGFTVSGAFAAHAERLAQLLETQTAEALDADGSAHSARRLGATAWRPGQQLEVQVAVSDRQAAAALATAVAGRFAAAIERLRADGRAHPPATEDLLHTQVEELRDRLARAEAVMEAAVIAMPLKNPETDRNGLLHQWREAHQAFTGLRRDLGQASTAVQELRTAPAPTHGVVSSEEREAAYADDPALVQDLRELEVNLSILRKEVLDVWDGAARHLAEFRKALTPPTEGLDGESPADAHHRTPIPTAAAADAVERTIARVAATRGKLRVSLEAFAESAADVVDRLHAAPTDGRSAQILEGCQQVRTLVGDFLYGVSGTLSELRAAVESLDEEIIEGARHHVLSSELRREFQAVEVAHHRFQFAAGAIEPADNFRLDAALRATRGLRRRTQERISEIEGRLQTMGRERARTRRLEQLHRAEAHLSETRAQADESIERILNLQEQLSVANVLTEDFLRTVLEAEHAAKLADLAQADLARRQSHLDRLREQRLAALDGMNARYEGCTVGRVPMELAGRLRQGGIAAALTLLTVGLVQWRTRPRGGAS